MKVNERKERRKGILVNNYQYNETLGILHANAHDCPYKRQQQQDNIDVKTHEEEEGQAMPSWSDIRQAVTRKLSNMSLRKFSTGKQTSKINLNAGAYQRGTKIIKNTIIFMWGGGGNS